VLAIVLVVLLRQVIILHLALVEAVSAVPHVHIQTVLRQSQGIGTMLLASTLQEVLLAAEIDMDQDQDDLQAEAVLAADDHQEVLQVVAEWEDEMVVLAVETVEATVELEIAAL